MKEGMIYQVTGVGTGHNRVIEGDFILCIEKTGDSHYSWALLKERTRNDWTVYYDVEKIYQAYGIEGNEVLEEPFTPEQMLHGVLAEKFSGRTAFLVRMPVAQIEDNLRVPCPTCGEPRLSYSVGKKNDCEGQAIILLQKG